MKAQGKIALENQINITLTKTDKICHVTESMIEQLKVVEDSLNSLVSTIKSDSDHQQTSTKEGTNTRECWKCA